MVEDAAGLAYAVKGESSFTDTKFTFGIKVAAGRAAASSKADDAKPSPGTSINAQISMPVKPNVKSTQ
ncbi:hypothetical protein LTS06_011412 [Exophiala xenobiotica]|nr:hypothetical protein LTS06_011412 [Exophiala xenobiotica]